MRGEIGGTEMAMVKPELGVNGSSYTILFT